VIDYSRRIYIGMASLAPRLLSRFTAAFLFLVFALSHCSHAQTPPYPPGNEFGVWGGYSLGNSHVFGITSDRQIGLLGFRYARTLYDKPFTSLQYTLDVIPLEILHQPTYLPCNIPSRLGNICASGHETVYGGGFNPIGLKLNFSREHWFQPFIASTAGLVASVRPVPVDISPQGTQFNFTFDLQAGLELFSSSRRSSWKLAYRFQHISNAYRHDYNPGVDAHEIYVAYSFFK
jgi:hypothetical protein